MKFLDALVQSPVKVSVGVLLVALFGLIAMSEMPMQLTPEVQTPTISIRTSWPGASPQEFEKQIINEQEEYLRSVEGVTKMSSSSYGPAGRITLEFAVGANMQEALLKVNSQLQQVPDYPEDADEPVITTSNFADRPIASFILSERRPSEAEFADFAEAHPELAAALEPIRATRNVGLAMLRLRELAAENETFASLLPPEDLNIVEMRRFVEDNIETRIERVDGVARADVDGGLEDELQVVVDPYELAARGLTITDVRDQIRGLNENVPGGFFDEGKRRWFVRTLGRFESPEQVENQLLTIRDGRPVYVRDVAEVRLGFQHPQGLVRRYGASSIMVSVIRENGANVLDVMDGLRLVAADLNEGVLKRQGLVLTQVYDETNYIHSSLDLVQSNIFVGGALTMIVLLAFLHLNARTLLTVPLILGTALAATYVSPWFFVLTLAVLVVTGFWFARGALVIGLAIPTSIIGTFLVMGLLDRSLNVVSLAGLAFAIGMLVDNAIVVLENIHRRYEELGESPVTASVRGVQEVWGAVAASTLTTVAVFLPVVFIQQEAGQLFRDIALAITAAILLSLVVSVAVIPAAAARLFHDRDETDPRARSDAGGNGDGRLADGDGPMRTREPGAARTMTIVAWANALSGSFVNAVVAANRWAQRGVLRRLSIVGVLVGASVGLTALLWPDVEYLPTGNRNLIVGSIIPPTGYNYEQMMQLGAKLEQNLRPYWDVEPETAADQDSSPPLIDDFYYVVNTWRVFIAVGARDPARAAELIPLILQAGADLPGTLVTATQTSLFDQRLSGGRTIDIEISGPELGTLTEIARHVTGILDDADPDAPGAQPLIPGAQYRANPALELDSPEVHVLLKPYQADQNDILTTDLGYTVDALVDGAYAGDYYLEGDKIDLVIEGELQYADRTQDLEQLSIATPLEKVIPLQAVADVKLDSGPEQIDHREGMRAITVEVSPPASVPLQEALRRIRQNIVTPIEQGGRLVGAYRIDLAGTADKLSQAWEALWFNLAIALLITYLLMAALFESWLYPFVIILSVPLGAVGGVLGLAALNAWLGLLEGLGVHGIRVQQLDVLTMLGFVILIGTVVNNPILIVHQAINHMREDGMTQRAAILESVRTRIRPIFMTTITTVLGLLPLVLFPGAGSELYRGLGSVVLGGLVVSTLFTLLLVPTLFSLMMDLKQTVARRLSRRAIDDLPANLETPKDFERPQTAGSASGTPSWVGTEAEVR